jgi:two-component system, OmpR family, copper resistance phosphate regulon response regulator CusR
MSTAQAANRQSRSRILVVDDEPQIREFIIRALVAAGYAVDAASDGRLGLRQCAARGYDLVILDLVMPETDGRAVLAALRHNRPEQPVIVLSCVSDVATKVDCLDLGATDYLTKPFALAELLARIRVQLRGERGHEHQLLEVLRAGQLVLHLGRLQADSGAGPVALTRLEVMVLRELMEHPGQAVPKEQLLAAVWGIDFDPGSNVVDVCIRRLRSKLGFELIETVRGAGYRLAC